MTMLRRTIPVEFSVLGDREVQITMSTSSRARDGHILEPAGCVLDNYRANPIVLWSHNPLEPIGNNEDVALQSDGLTARTVFAPAGISAEADKICGLVKSNVIRSVSIGFVILDGEPIDPQRPRAGLRATKWELLECSFVSVPADTGAIVTARAVEEPDMTANPAIRDFSAIRTRMLTGTAPKLRSLWDCAYLAEVLSTLGWLHDSAEWEAEIEGDNSPVPAMLGEALKQIGETLIAMTSEEVNELLAGHGVIDDADLPEGERSASPRVRAWRAATKVRAGKVLSAANRAALTDAHSQIEAGCAAVRSFLDATDEAADKTIETGSEDDETRGSDADYRKRLANLLSLSAA